MTTTQDAGARSRAMLGALVLLTTAVLALGCVAPAETGADETDDHSDEALSGTNDWLECKEYGETIDSFDKEAIHCNHPEGAGAYQCVEYADRFETKVNHKPVIGGNATDFCSNAHKLAGYHVYNPAGTWGHPSKGHRPVAGDLLVWGGGSRGFGHVAVVDASSSGTEDVHYMQQNWGWYVKGKWGQVAHSETKWSTAHSFFEAPGGGSAPNSHYAKCWIHPE